ncbi:bifunctional phosphoribosyl-AMP cyclohydrolase/phosphoribosyl-ATP diphosphatase HisIE [Sporolactobacillus terrae]|uniref:Histidine biosynthesis bifunctional protein HisIE n=1 Tax=Sporolactobacillus terrae TaxID=269673 RepID=A0ABX5Q8Q8_9BACL|nr:bifunctional phosphoribosyl-AMP cyclohydrolase/phosphoribosyl-ATP diphosphatase HisIE [Sporolactobacillus terrae]QAA23027.1 bifunctional phosphoribosyl-AMP cyclohydrolase/phosphoribosyl-ATP pyrophosphatase [Sporolactobacillus terrae]QAA26000.1 bifunctional phosphoribosyl-AMP cyclohydrolase/phosphoribosyl-ATP pyrophosphatase [Sporolactobacillus terrae]UAK15094.1 bifunctional phosphoribosyl-AMP cyclohydrolase/phosphoribosyl-ATP diphosphatase HisIE [Sporolactobacillus terrae]
MNAETLKYNEQGLIPAIVQDVQSKEILMMAYMNKESINKSLESGETWFYSRSRQELWHKGATSGNTQKIVDWAVDCDSDTLLIKVKPAGPACHTGKYSCFVPEKTDKKEAETVGSARYEILAELEHVIAKREAERPEGTYTTYLFNEGIDKILKKIGEETSEVIIAAKNHSIAELEWEVSDVVYHTLVMLREQGVGFDRVLRVLEQRHRDKSEFQREKAKDLGL